MPVSFRIARFLQENTVLHRHAQMCRVPDAVGAVIGKNPMNSLSTGRPVGHCASWFRHTQAPLGKHSPAQTRTDVYSVCKAVAQCDHWRNPDVAPKSVCADKRHQLLEMRVCALLSDSHDTAMLSSPVPVRLSHTAAPWALLKLCWCPPVHILYFAVLHLLYCLHGLTRYSHTLHAPCSCATVPWYMHLTLLHSTLLLSTLLYSTLLYCNVSTALYCGAVRCTALQCKYCTTCIPSPDTVALVASPIVVLLSLPAACPAQSAEWLAGCGAS